ncbi:MAG: transposase, partial [Planctomycetes bacterium]|nr:transposase [Planctomycetota bacterium]
MLSKSARHAVATVIREVCDHHDWILHASNVRSNHVHVVVSAPRTPEQVMIALKAWCTRRLRQLGLSQKDAKVWSRHGSTK